MAGILRGIKYLFVSVCVLFSTLFSLGEAPDYGFDMPETHTGEYTQWVDPFIGTGGVPWVSAMTSPAASTPFGMVRLGPDSSSAVGYNPFGFLGTSGYYYGHSHLWGFSHTRLSGTGVIEGGAVRVTPSAGKSNHSKRLSSPLIYSHESETAAPGYYAVYLPTEKCLAELTAVSHSGVHRYTFGTSKDAHLLIDATSFLARGSAADGIINVDPESGEIYGRARLQTGFSARYGGLYVYFSARLNREFESFSTWSGEDSVQGRTEASGDDVGVDLCFGDIKGQSVELYVGISYVSIKNARENLEAEVGGADFDAVRSHSVSEWDEWLSRIKIESGDSEIKTIFYTALYHSMLMPTDFTDVNGEYLGFKRTVGKAEGFTYRTDMSLWDTFRTTHPLYILIAPEIQTDCLKSLVLMAKAGGTLPRWPSGAGYTGSMFGTPADMVIAESYLKGITDFDVEAAYKYMKLTSEKSVGGADYRSAVEEYNKYGYVPADKADKSASRTLEYAWADASISKLAGALGYADEAEHYYNKSMNYKNIFDPNTKYFRGKNSDGSWLEPFSTRITSFYDEVLVRKYATAYCEGSARHWRWSAVQDVDGLIELFGSKEYFVSELDDFMSDASRNMSAIDPGDGYWQGNQHDIHCAYLFNDAGRPELTQKWVRWILTERHGTGVNGIDGNDDGGTLSSWYVFSSMGLYPQAGSDKYWIGAPIVDRAEINLTGGKTLTVVAKNQSEKNMYVDSVTFNGVPLTDMTISHSLIADGGTLEFVMSPTPA